MKKMIYKIQFVNSKRDAVWHLFISYALFAFIGSFTPLKLRQELLPESYCIGGVSLIVSSDPAALMLVAFLALQGLTTMSSDLAFIPTICPS